jgi:hypothetical protein
VPKLGKEVFGKMKCMLLSLLVLSLLVIPCITDALDIDDDDLLLYLPLNGDTEDLSKYGNHGEIVGSADFVDGKFEEALEFNEAGEVSCPYIPLNEKSFTICLWVNPALSGASEQCVFTQTQNNATNTSLHFRIYTNGTVRMGFYSNDLDAPGAVTAGEWTHICFWLDVEEESRRIYLNGVQAVEDAGKAGIFYLGTSGNTMIGSWGNTGQKFNGIIDEVQVWDRALTESEISQSMGELTALAVNASGKLTATWGGIKHSF